MLPMDVQLLRHVCAVFAVNGLLPTKSMKLLLVMLCNRKTLSFKEKLEVLSKADSKLQKKRSNSAKELSLSLLCTIAGQRDMILKMCSASA